MYQSTQNCCYEPSRPYCGLIRSGNEDSRTTHFPALPLSPAFFPLLRSSAQTDFKQHITTFRIRTNSSFTMTMTSTGAVEQLACNGNGSGRNLSHSEPTPTPSSYRKRSLESSPLDTAASTAHGNRRKAKKVSRACDRCKAKKEKCTGTKPCEGCTRRDFQCVYDAKYSRGRPPTPPSTISADVTDRDRGRSNR